LEFLFFQSQIEILKQQLFNAFEFDNFSPRTIAKIMTKIIQEGSRFQKIQKCLFDLPTTNLSKNYRRTAVALGAAGLKLLVDASAAVTPKIAKDLKLILRISERHIDRDKGSMFFPAGHKLNLTQEIKLPRIPADIQLKIYSKRFTTSNSRFKD